MFRIRLRNALVLALFVLAAVLLLAGALAPIAKSQTPTGAESPTIPTLYVVGDSTANNGRERGWASHLQPFFDADKLHVVNRARGGRSSRTFQTEGLWDKVVAELKPGDFVLIQFGHNDGGPIDRERARGSIRGIGDDAREVTLRSENVDDKQETVHTFGWYLRKSIADARAKNATPILLSQVVRNDWRDGKVQRPKSYPLWAVQVADTEHCLLVDAHSIIADRYDQMGQEAVKPFFPEEHTHTNADGAKLNAELIVSGLKALADSPFDGCLSGKGREVKPYRAKPVN